MNFEDLFSLKHDVGMDALYLTTTGYLIKTEQPALNFVKDDALL